MKKKIILTCASLILLLAGFVYADYLSLFGTTNKEVLDFAVIQFKPVDEESGAPIYDTHAVCFRHRNHNACTIRDTGRGDVVAAYFPMYKTVRKSLFFTQSEEMKMPLDGEIRIMLIHNNYQSKTNIFNMENIYKNSGQLLSIKMRAK